MLSSQLPGVETSADFTFFLVSKANEDVGVFMWIDFSRLVEGRKKSGPALGGDYAIAYGNVIEVGSDDNDAIGSAGE